MMQSVDNILFAGNASFVQHAAVAMRSLLETNTNRQFRIVFAGRNLSETDSQNLHATVKDFPGASLEIRGPAEETLSLLERGNYSVDIYQRYFIDRFFPAGAGRALYLDADTLVLGPVGDLLDVDLQGKPIAAVAIPGSKRLDYYNFPPGLPYFNSGVMLFDLHQWRSENYAQRLARATEHYARYLRDPDQDILNACFVGNWVEVPPIWNALRPIFLRSSWMGLSEEALDAILDGVRVVHFNGPIKPWHYVDNHPLKDRYWDVLTRTPYRGYRPADDTMSARLRKVTAPWVPQRLKRLLRRPPEPPKLPTRLPAGERLGFVSP